MINLKNYKNKELQTALKIISSITKNGNYEAYIVGGTVRDIIIGTDPKDIDIATNMPIVELEKLFKTYNIGQSKSFGIVIIKENGFDFEVAQYRSDGEYLDGRRPESVKITNRFKDDVERRDFTINALGIDVKGKIIDYVDGEKDIKSKVLKTVGNPYKRFEEDFLRMMRLARFSSKLAFTIDKETKKAVKKLSHNIVKLAPERIKDELIKSASQSGDKFAEYIITLDQLKLLKYILPEIVNLKYFRENLHHHPETRGKGGTVFSHTIEALKISDSKDPIKNLAILFHDIGKGITLTHRDGLPRYLGHAKKSVELVNSIVDRLKFSNKERDAIVFAVGHHMKFHDILDMRPSKIAAIVSDDNYDVLITVAKADEYARGPIFKYSGRFELIVIKAIEIKERFKTRMINKQIKVVDGNHVMNLTGLKPGPKVGQIIKHVTEEVMDNNIEDKEEINQIILNYKKYIY